MSPAARIRRTPVRLWLPSANFFAQLSWLDGRPLPAVIEPYRQQIFTQVLDTFSGPGVLRYNLALIGRAKKNYKSCDLVLAALFALLGNDSLAGGNECLIVASDEGQADEDLELAKKLVEVNPNLQAAVLGRDTLLKRRDGRGRLRILPGRDVAGEHGKTYRFLGIDEIHTQRDWDLLEALALDPTRPDAQQWITSYASIYHRPGVPLHDLVAQAKLGADPRMFFSWYAGDYTTDASAHDLTPEARANPSRGSWADADYLAQQARRLPSHKFRRLHLNLPGLPEGSAFQPEPIAESIDRGVHDRLPEPGVTYYAFVDMSGGSKDDAVCGISHLDADGRAVLDRLLNQGGPCPFDPAVAVRRFATLCKEYGITHLTGDRYAGLTFVHAFAKYGLTYDVCPSTTSQLYEGLEPHLNGGTVRLPDVPTLEQQLLGLIWKGGKITHVSGEHDDWATAAAGACLVALAALGPSLADLEQLNESEVAFQAEVARYWNLPVGEEVA